MTKLGFKALSGVTALTLCSPLTKNVANWLDNQPSLCGLHAITGSACPLCGGTRSALYLLSGDPFLALERNAAITATLSAICILTIVTLRKRELLLISYDDTRDNFVRKSLFPRVPKWK